MPENTQILLVIWSFWLVVIGLDLVALFRLRRSPAESVARALWAVWIIVAPVVGALSFFIVQPTPRAGAGRVTPSTD